MNIFKALFGGKEENPEEEKKHETDKNFDVLKYDGIRALKMGQNEYAIKCLTKALEINDDIESRDYLAQALLGHNELLPAYEQYRKLAEAQPDNQNIWLMIARVTYMMEDYNAMSEACEKAMLIDDKNPEVSFQYARACIGQGDAANGISMASKAILLDENYSDAYLLRANTYLKNGKLDEADNDANWLLEHEKDNEDALILKARVEKAKGQLDESLNYYDQVIDVNPFSVDAFRERAAVKDEKGDKVGAQEDLARLLEINPKEASDVTSEESTEGIEQKTLDAYRNNNPFGLGG